MCVVGFPFRDELISVLLSSAQEIVFEGSTAEWFIKVTEKQCKVDVGMHLINDTIRRSGVWCFICASLHLGFSLLLQNCC